MRPRPAGPHRHLGADALGDKLQWPAGWGWETGSSSGRDPSCPSTAHGAAPTGSPCHLSPFLGPQGPRPAAPIPRTSRGDRHPRAARPFPPAARCTAGPTQASRVGSRHPGAAESPSTTTPLPALPRGAGPGSLIPAPGPPASAPPPFPLPSRFPVAPAAHFSISKAATFLFS